MRLFHRHTNCKPSYILSLGRLSNAALGKVQVRFYSTDNDSKKDDSDDKSRDKRRNDFFHGNSFMHNSVYLFAFLNTTLMQ